MAFIPITKEHIDTVTLEMHPKRMYSSSSVNGVTGSVYVYANRSPFNRQRIESSPFSEYAADPSSLQAAESAYQATSYETTFDALVSENPTPLDPDTEDRSWAYENYLNQVNIAKVSPELNKFMEIWRFKPSYSFTSNTLRKNAVKDVLFKYYSGIYAQLDWAYTNYNCLTFFTASTVTPNSALIYPAPLANSDYNQYLSTSSFSLSFWVNPRKTTLSDLDEYKAGTILHLSSSYAVSIVTGSEKNDLGLPETFRVLLQLSHSADIAPSEIDLSIPNNTRPYPQDLIYVSKDNSLKLNNWHHVNISWDANHNFGTGSMWVDNSSKSQVDFLIASASINTAHTGTFVPLIVGNYYNSDNEHDHVAGYTTMEKFFNDGCTTQEGLESRGVSSGIVVLPETLDHKPNADVHDIRVYDKYLSPLERESVIAAGPENLNNLLFYLPTFYVKESPYRQMLTTPYLTQMSASAEPFNTVLSFGVGGHDLNIENFTRDFVNKLYPRHYNLTASLVTADSMYATANEILWEKSPHPTHYSARQLLLLPCDNGNFNPNFNLLKSGSNAFRPGYTPQPRTSDPIDQFLNDRGELDYSIVSLRNLVSTRSVDELHILSDPYSGESDIAMALAGSPPTIVDEDTGEPVADEEWYMSSGDANPADTYDLTVIQRTQDNSSNELYFFDASNLFYGNRIQPNSFVLEDTSLTGSSGRASLKIKDDGFGNLYRADCLSAPCKWNSVGNILYDEGIAVIKSPNIPLIGEDQFSISFTGLHNVHTYEVNVILSPNLFTSSSNPSFKGGKADSYSNTSDGKYVAFNSIQLHDDNLNVITRSNLAQPVVKKIGDKYLVRIKIDY